MTVFWFFCSPFSGHGAVVVGHGLGLGYGYGLGLGLGLHAGDGYEGQYVPSGNELHYDDGSYRGDHHYDGYYGHY